MDAESCDLNPRKECRYATKLVPRLTPVQECTLVPKEVCQLKFSAPVPEKKPFLTKVTWCSVLYTIMYTLTPPGPKVPRIRSGLKREE